MCLPLGRTLGSHASIHKAHALTAASALIAMMLPWHGWLSLQPLQPELAAVVIQVTTMLFGDDGDGDGTKGRGGLGDCGPALSTLLWGCWGGVLLLLCLLAMLASSWLSKLPNICRLGSSLRYAQDDCGGAPNGASQVLQDRGQRLWTARAFRALNTCYAASARRGGIRRLLSEEGNRR